MSFAPVAVALIGGLVSGVGTFMQAQAAANAAEYQAKVDRINAQHAAQQAGQDAAAKRRERQRMIGSIRARAGATGLQMTGSVLDLMTDSFLESHYDERLIEYQGSIKSTDYRNRANLEEARADSERFAGGIGLVSGFLSGAGKALSVA